MKNSALLILTALGISACNSHDASPPSPSIANVYDNTVTRRQKIVETFHTSDVAPLPYSSDEFIVRDINGAIWFVNTATIGNPPNCGSTMLFSGPGTNTWSLRLPAAPDPDLVDLSNRVALATVAFDAMVQSIAKAQARTTNVLIEDPDKKK
jgi:hypothetical protein